MTKISTAVLLLASCISLSNGFTGSLSPRSTVPGRSATQPKLSGASRRSTVRLDSASAVGASSEGPNSTQLNLNVDVAEQKAAAGASSEEADSTQLKPSVAEQKADVGASSKGAKSIQLTAEQKKQKRREAIREEGGRFAFNTKYGALNPYGIYYGLTAILLGLPWFAALTCCQFLYFITGNRFDRLRRLPVFFNHLWGVTLMRLTRQVPKVENRQVLLDFYKRKQAAMFCSNHNSWMDIPYLGSTIGWRNYKLVSKAELGKVPILGKAIKVGGNIMLDRTNRRSQLKTLKDGIQLLKDGVHLCTFPEGTRSRSGRIMKFKNGAFKMAHKCEAPVVPVSIVGSGKVHPPFFMFPCRPSKGVAKVVVHEPVESKGITEDDLGKAVRDSIITGLPDDQRPQ